MMKLTYNPRSGHVKINGAVVGRIVNLQYTPFDKAPVVIRAADLKTLLASIKAHHEQS